MCDERKRESKRERETAKSSTHALKFKRGGRESNERRRGDGEGGGGGGGVREGGGGEGQAGSTPLLERLTERTGDGCIESKKFPPSLLREGGREDGRTGSRTCMAHALWLTGSSRVRDRGRESEWIGRVSE